MISIPFPVYGLCAIVLALAHVPQSRAANVEDPTLHAYLNQSCIVADEPFLFPDDGESSTRSLPLMGLVIGRLAQAFISGAVKATAGQISSAAARKDTTYALARDFHLYSADLRVSPTVTLNAEFGCLTIVAGQFSPAQANCRADYVPREISPATINLPEAEWTSTRSDNSIQNVLRRANVCLSSEPAAVYEARLLSSEDGTAFRFRGAGYWIDRLLTTSSTRASRHVIYTLELVEPTSDVAGKVLSMAWVNLGQIKAGSSGAAAAIQGRSDWQLIPTLSAGARRAYDQQTSVHQEVHGEITALERSVLRDQRLLAGIEKRLTSASPEVRDGLRPEMIRLESRIITSEAMLDARRAEYVDLPREIVSFMPVTVQIGVTESRSEKSAMVALAEVLDTNSANVAAVAAGVMGIERGFDSGTSGGERTLDDTRTEYFDALVALRTAGADSDQLGEATQALSVAREKYNAARRSLDLDPIE